MGLNRTLTILLLAVVQYVCVWGSTEKQRPGNDNHHILFLLANVTPTNDFKGALLSCGFEAAAHVAAKVGYQVAFDHWVEGACNQTPPLPPPDRAGQGAHHGCRGLV